MEALIAYLFTTSGLLVLLGLLTLLFIRSSTKGYTIWKDRGIPFVPPKPFFESLFEYMSKPRHETELQRYKKYGAIYGHFSGSSALLSVADPKLLKCIMVKDFHIFSNRRTMSCGDKISESMLQMLHGEDWKRVRSIVSPTFTTAKIKRMMDIFSTCSKMLIRNFKKYADEMKPVEVKSAYGAFTMDSIASAAFSTKIDSQNDPNNEFVRMAVHMLRKNINKRALFHLMFPRIMKLFRVPVFPPKSINFFTKITLQLVEERKRTGQRRNDFLQLLMDTANEESEEQRAPEKTDDILSNYEGEGNNQYFKNFRPSKKTLSSNELVAQCVIFFLAGFETTSTTLSFVSYYLALHPDIQDKLIEEIDRTIEESDGKLTYEGIQSMRYLDNVISETMRLSSPLLRLERIASEDYPLGDTGFVVPKGVSVTIPIYAIHKDEKYFPDPEKFDPDRFTPEERAKRDPYTFMPFGAGPRNCIGMRFSLIQVKTSLAHVLSNFRIRRCDQTKVPLDFYISQGLLKPKGIVLQMEKRNDGRLKG